MPLPQIISMISIILLTVVAIILGIQLMYIFKEIHYTLTKTNRTLDSVSDTLEKISQPAIGFFAILEGLKESGKFVEMFNHFLGRSEPKPQAAEEDFYDNSL